MCKLVGYVYPTLSDMCTHAYTHSRIFHMHAHIQGYIYVNLYPTYTYIYLTCIHMFTYLTYIHAYIQGYIYASAFVGKLGAYTENYQNVAQNSS